MKKLIAVAVIAGLFGLGGVGCNKPEDTSRGSQKAESKEKKDADKQANDKKDDNRS